MKVIFEMGSVPTEIFNALYRFVEVMSKYEPGYDAEVKIKRTPNRLLVNSGGMTHVSVEEVKENG